MNYAAIVVAVAGALVLAWVAITDRLGVWQKVLIGLASLALALLAITRI
jgi:hypothetical protein